LEPDKSTNWRRKLRDRFGFQGHGNKREVITFLDDSLRHDAGNMKDRGQGADT